MALNSINVRVTRVGETHMDVHLFLKAEMILWSTNRIYRDTKVRAALYEKHKKFSDFNLPIVYSSFQSRSI